MTDLVEFVKAHALAHYEDGGWDVVFECFTDAEIADVIGDAKTEDKALIRIYRLVEVYADRQADAINSAF